MRDNLALHPLLLRMAPTIHADSARDCVFEGKPRSWSLARSLRCTVCMSGLLRIAYKLLVNDRGKFIAVLMGITFSVFLMVQMTSMFSGMMKKASATVTNTGASMWIMDRSVTNMASAVPLPDYVLDAARSMEGVRFAVPLYSGNALLHLKSGVYQPVSVIGLDDNSLFGRPSLIAGQIENIYAENGFVVVKDEEYGKLENPGIGAEFESAKNVWICAS